MDMFKLHSADDEDNIVFQLELNLQTIRRDLIQLLDEYPHTECYLCNKLKCRCPDYRAYSVISFESCHNSDLDSGIFDFRSPPADTLPIPEWKTNSIFEFETWIRNSIAGFSINKYKRYPISKTVLNKMNLTWPPFAKSVWSSDFKCVKEKDVIRMMFEKERNSVDDFFMYFKNKRVNLNVY